MGTGGDAMVFGGPVGLGLTGFFEVRAGIAIAGILPGMALGLRGALRVQPLVTDGAPGRRVWLRSRPLPASVPVASISDKSGACSARLSV
jgi:hypothetical protein